MARKSLKRYLMLLSAVGLLVIGTSGSGTFASFNAEVANTGNYFATGTIFLHETDSAGSNTCTSEADTANNNNVATTNGCDTLFTIRNIQENTNNPAVTLTLTNAGSIDASKLQFALGSACTQSKSLITTMTSINTGTNTITVPTLPYTLFKNTVLTLSNGTDPAENVTVTSNPSAPASVGSTTFTYSGSLTATYGAGTKIYWGQQFGSQTNLCNKIQVYVEEDANLGGSATKCLFGGNAGATAACTFGSGAGTTINGLTTSLSSNSFTAASLGSSTNVAAMDAGNSRFLKVGWKLPTGSLNSTVGQENSDQNNAANFSLKWHIEQ